METEQAKKTARHIVENLPDYFRTSVQEWRMIEARIVSILRHAPDPAPDDEPQTAAEGGAGPSDR